MPDRKEKRINNVCSRETASQTVRPVNPLMIFSTRNPIAIGVLLILALGVDAEADVKVRFIEGAPKDKFVITNTGSCAISDSSVRIDLSTATGKLIFDVTDQGEGVNVFQPFEVVEGAESLRAIPSIRDGQSSVRLDIASLEPGAVIAFTTDVDDTIGQRETMISNTEIQGAVVSYIRNDNSLIGEFSDNSEALLAIPGCGTG